MDPIRKIVLMGVSRGCGKSLVGQSGIEIGREVYRWLLYQRKTEKRWVFGIP